MCGCEGDEVQRKMLVVSEVEEAILGENCEGR
jgi:hypothetical protein